MSEAAHSIGERAALIRRQFDQAFSQPVRLDDVVREDMLAIRIGEQGYAMRLPEIAGLHADKAVTRVPGAGGALLGIAGFRGSLLPVYDLHALLGHTGGERRRWLVVASAAPIAFAFAAFERQLRVPRDAILPRSARPADAELTRGFVQMQAFSGPVLHLPALLHAIEKPALVTPRKD